MAYRLSDSFGRCDPFACADALSRYRNFPLRESLPSRSIAARYRLYSPTVTVASPRVSPVGFFVTTLYDPEGSPLDSRNPAGPLTNSMWSTKLMSSVSGPQ